MIQAPVCAAQSSSRMRRARDSVDPKGACWPGVTTTREASGATCKPRPPALRRWPRVAAHVPSDRRLGDIEAELEQLTVNTRRAPKCVRTAHLADERAQLSRDLGSANTVAGSPAPSTRSKAEISVPCTSMRRPSLLSCSGRRSCVTATSTDLPPVELNLAATIALNADAHKMLRHI